MTISQDITATEQLEHMVNHILEKMGKVDVLINNAGVNIPQKAEKVTVEEWDKILDINLKSTFFMNQAVGVHMRKQKKGKLLICLCRWLSLDIIKEVLIVQVRVD